MSYLKALGFGLLLVAFYSLPSRVFADGISVTPSIINLDLDIDEPETIIYYKNNTSETIELEFKAVDFTELEEGWQVKFLDQKDAANYHYSLSPWIDFEKSSLTLAAGEQREVKLFINKDDLNPGAHYASILAEVKQEQKDNQFIQLKAVVSSLLFVRTATGKEIETAQIHSLSPLRKLLFFPEKFTLRFNNTGNVELIPHGLLEIKDPFGKQIATGILNEGSLITLPNSIRRYIVPIQKSAIILYPGVYSAKTNVKYGKNEINLNTETHFFSLGNIGLPLIYLGSLITIIVVTIKKRKLKKQLHQKKEISRYS